jgi:hypothetical protein
MGSVTDMTILCLELKENIQDCGQSGIPEKKTHPPNENVLK